MPSFKAVIFDLDGVITQTASVHARAWKDMFDEYLKQREARHGETFKEFTKTDYLKYVDGKPRYKGVESFLQTRDIDIPFGEPADNPDRETISGLGNRKNVKFTEILENDGVEIFQSTVDLIKDLKENRVRIGVASSSKNCRLILQKTDLEKYFETRVDGVVSAELGLKGKPQADIFVRAAENLNSKPGESIVVEDAVSGVQAGRNGNFALVIGLAREGNEKELQENGADIVLKDFNGALTKDLNEWFRRKNN